MKSYLYLHGFASSPRSRKATYLSERFNSCGLKLKIPDLNHPGFSGLTLTRQLQQITSELPKDGTPVVLIGSSFGGLTAAWAAEHCPQVERLVLLAPAFCFLDHWLPKLGSEQLRHWQEHGEMPIYHYGADAMLPLRYGFIRDMQHYPESQIQRPVPTRILHGMHDDVIPIVASREFAGSRPWVQLTEMNSDHGLGNVLSQLWQAIQDFCNLKTLP
ncbi:MAG TPA: YqiA/YcfP family alpha/beta fold hydrolase [Elainellaceae cyanobacterium]